LDYEAGRDLYDEKSVASSDCESFWAAGEGFLLQEVGRGVYTSQLTIKS